MQLSTQQGKFVLVHFWATWCEPCREELPALLKFTRALPQSERFTFFAISEDRDWKKVQEYFDGQVPPEIVWDFSGEGEKSYEISTLPDTYLVSPQGKLLLRFGGARNWSSSQAQKLFVSELSKFRAR
jgi:thiol-disulfide isomerase/thioredoxin